MRPRPVRCGSFPRYLPPYLPEAQPDPDEAPKPDWGKSDAARREAAAKATAIKAVIVEEHWPAAMAQFVQEVEDINLEVRKME